LTLNLAQPLKNRRDEIIIRRRNRRRVDCVYRFLCPIHIQNKMSKVWPSVTAKQPCGICHKADWCQVGGEGWCCYRVQSSHPLKCGGWFHRFDSKSVPTPVKRHTKPIAVAPTIDCERLLLGMMDDTPIDRLYALAVELGVSRDALIQLCPAWSHEKEAWCFPMRDGAGKVIGIRTRKENGEKRAYFGSQNGLFIPGSIPISKPLFICEGPTDTAAVLTLGYYAIGRASCGTCARWIKQFCDLNKIWQVVIVADGDKAGLQGARKLAKDLHRRYQILVLPQKDIRDYAKNGGGRVLVDSLLKDLAVNNP
jgi:5S rRNA maturation endonuclease (ribonuclease M5)